MTTRKHHGKEFDPKNTRHARVLALLQGFVQEQGDNSIYGTTVSEMRTTACDWAEYTTLKPSDMPRWWAAWCCEPEAAQEFKERGIGAGLAKRSGGMECEGIDTLAYHVSMGRLTVRQAQRRLGL